MFTDWITLFSVLVLFKGTIFSNGYTNYQVCLYECESDVIKHSNPGSCWVQTQTEGGRVDGQGDDASHKNAPIRQSSQRRQEETRWRWCRSHYCIKLRTWQTCRWPFSPHHSLSQSMQKSSAERWKIEQKKTPLWDWAAVSECTHRHSIHRTNFEQKKANENEDVNEENLEKVWEGKMRMAERTCLLQKYFPWNLNRFSDLTSDMTCFKFSKILLISSKSTPASTLSAADPPERKKLRRQRSYIQWWHRMTLLRMSTDRYSVLRIRNETRERNVTEMWWRTLPT